MVRWKQCVIVLVVFFLSSFVVGCRKEKEGSDEKAEEEKRVESRARKACEKAVEDYLNALAAEDYRKAVDLIDVEEMLAKSKGGPSPSSPPMDATGIKEGLLRMIETAGRLRKGKLTHEILGSRVSGEKASVEVAVYRDGEFADKWTYPLTRRDEQWKLSGSAAIRALAPPRKKGAPGMAPR